MGFYSSQFKAMRARNDCTEYNGGVTPTYHPAANQDSGCLSQNLPTLSAVVCRPGNTILLYFHPLGSETAKIGSVLNLEISILYYSYYYSKFIYADEQSDDDIMHLHRGQRTGTSAITISLRKYFFYS